MKKKNNNWKTELFDDKAKTDTDMKTDTVKTDTVKTDKDMKTDKAKTDNEKTDTGMNINKVKIDKEMNTDNAEFDTKKDELQTSILINILPFLSMAAVIIPSVMLQRSGIQIARLSLLTLILSAAVVFYVRMNSVFLLNKRFSKYIISFSYLICLSLSILIPRPDIFCFWMIGGLLVSMLIDYKLGLLLHLNITFILGILLNANPEEVIQLLIMGLLLCLLSGYLKQKATVIYASIIILSLNITLSFIIHNFIIDYKTNQNYLWSFFCVLTVLVISYFLYEILYRYAAAEMETLSGIDPKEDNLDKVSMQALPAENEYRMNNNSKASPVNEQSTEEADLNVEKEYIETGYLKTLKSSYELLNDEDNILLQKMKEYSAKLYDHCVRIGDISSRAAKIIGADEMLAKAGGLYHDVGKMAGKNYIEEGLKIAEEYSFPNELKDIIKQHNIKYEKPTSIEAAIVMFSDNLLSTIEYIAQTGDNKFTVDKIIDNLFHMRIEKGTLDDSGLTVKDFKLLKDFYLQEFDSK